jgi:hypothetical protein
VSAGEEDILESLSHKVERHQLFAVELVDLMEKQKKELGCPDLLVPRFFFEIVKQLELNGTLPILSLSLLPSSPPTPILQATSQFSPSFQW